MIFKKKNNPQVVMICGNNKEDRTKIVNKIIKRLAINKFLLIKFYNNQKIKIIFFNNKIIRKKLIKKIEKNKFFKLKNENKFIIIENGLQNTIDKYPFLVNCLDVIIVISESNLLGIKDTYGIASKFKNFINSSKNGLHIIMKSDTKNPLDLFIIKMIFYKLLKVKEVKKIKL